jgi:hypothetical protein
MRKLLFCTTLLLLIFGAAVSLQAAECPNAVPMTPAATPDAGALVPDQEAGVADIFELNPLSSAEEKLPPPPNCQYLACQQTPTGCGCEGFYCNGIFYCGIPWH